MKHRGHSSGDYVVWDVWNQTEETAYRIGISSETDPDLIDAMVTEAAAQGAEMMHEQGDHFESTDVCVKDLKTGQRWLVSIVVEMVPSFRGDAPRLLEENKDPEVAAKEKISEINEKAREVTKRFFERLDSLKKG